MSTAAFVSQPTVIRIPSLLAEVRDGLIRVPRFQRPPVWNQTQRIELLESIKQGIPIGSLLIWRTRKYANELDVYPLGPGSERPLEPGEAQQFVLDGHQRLTTLFMILGWGLIAPELRPSPEERASGPFYGDIDPLYYDLENEKFEGWSGRKPPPAHWLPLDELFDDFALYELISGHLGSRPNGRLLVNRARALHKLFYDFQIAMVPISTDDLQSAIVSFERANTAGTKMSEAHMVSALVYKSDIDVNQELDEILQGLDGWTELEPKYVLAISKALLNLDLFSSQTKRLVEEIKQDHGLIERTKQALANAVIFLGSQCNIWGPETLPYSYQLVLIADVLQDAESLDNAELRERLERWLWVTSYVEYFASISSSRLRATLESLRSYAMGDSEMLPFRYSNAEVQPPRRFDFRSARSRVLALMMARELVDEVPEVYRLLALFGHRAMPKLLSWGDLQGHNDEGIYLLDPSEGFENRFIAHPQHVREIRKRIRGASPDDSEFLLRHGIDAGAAEHLRSKKLDAFVGAREALFLAKEKQFVESLGLTYASEAGPRQ